MAATNTCFIGVDPEFATLSQHRCLMSRPELVRCQWSVNPMDNEQDWFKTGFNNVAQYN